MQRNFGISLLGLTLLAALSASAQATIIVDNYWRLGEDDPGAVSGNTVNATTEDNTNNLDLTRTNGTTSITYSSDAAPGATLSVNFNVNPYFSATGTTTTATDNFGYEIWIKPASGQNGDRNIFGNDRIAFIVNANEFRGIYQGIAVLDPTVNTSVANFYDQWTHLALVRDNGVTTFYLNGVASTVTNSALAPVAPTGGTYISQPNGTSVHRLDEARIFHFTAGQFQVSDLLYPSVVVPEPSSLSMLLFGCVSLWLFRRKRIM